MDNIDYESAYRELLAQYEHQRRNLLNMNISLAKIDTHFQLVTNHTKDVIWTTDMDFNTTFITPSILQMTGYTPAEILYKNFETFLSPESRTRAHNHLSECLAQMDRPEYENLRQQPIEIQYIHKDGSYVDVEITSSFIRDERGEIVGIAGISRNLTNRNQDRQQLEQMVSERTQALAKSEKRYRLLADNSKDVIVTFDLSLKTTYVSPSIEGATGYSIAEFLNCDINELLTPQSLQTILNYYNTVIASPEDKRPQPFSDKIEIECICKDGHKMWVEMNTAFLRDDSCSPIGILAVGRDISDRKAAEAENLKIQEQLIQAQKMESIGRLAGGVAHDFNNMLTAMLGYTDLLLLKTGHNAEISSDLRKIRQVCNRATSLTNQLLAFSRRQMLKKNNIHLNDLLSDIDSMLGCLMDNRITLRRNLAEELWPVCADKINIEQVIMNLFINAIDAIDGAGTIEISTANIEIDHNDDEKHPGNFVCLSITDSGQGMDAAMIGEIFEPFFTTKETGKGTGLGLAVVYGIIKQHDGWIDISSNPGSGSTFKVYLPAVLDEEQKVESIQRRNEPTLSAGEKILLVEDEKDVRELARIALTQHRYQVIEASNAEDAIEIYKSDGDFDLVFSDVILPNMSGLELSQAIREISPNIPIVLTSGHMDNRSQWPQIKERGLPFLQKPYSLRDLIATIQRSLN